MVIEVARQYLNRGWSVIPVPHGSKNPGIKGWQKLRLAESDLPDQFGGRLSNIGVLLGAASDWLVDVDLDHPLAVKLADQFLPPTPAVFGRPGNPRSHRLYRVSRAVATKKYKSKSAGTIVELRANGCQTVMPPSTHTSGEQISWDNEHVDPAEVSAEQLRAAVARLADVVLDDLGEGGPQKGVSASNDPPGTSGLVSQCVNAMLRMRMLDQNDGSTRLFAAACRSVEHDLSDSDAVTAIREYASQHPFPKIWTDEDILRRVRDAEKRCDRGSALVAPTESSSPKRPVALGTRDPLTGRLVLSQNKTVPTAQAFIRQFHSHPDGRTLHWFGGLLFQWTDGRYTEVEDGALRSRLQDWLHTALKYAYNRKTKEMELVDFCSNPTTVSAALESIKAAVHLPVHVITPSWLTDRPDQPPANELLPCRSSLLHLPTMKKLDGTPALFNTNSIEFDHDPDAANPIEWLRFLHQLFDDDIQSQELLQEWAGYSLVADTSQQKMLLLVGPRRSGKGTIARVLTKLVGQGNVCGPTTSSLAGPFGLQPLIGKTLAVISDARFSGDGVQTVVERLLCISGEDALTIERKYLSSVTLKLSTRFMLLTNELPRFRDASAALAGRFVILRTTESFFGNEDHGLTGRLMNELPGILNWAIAGWHRLRERGRFILPTSVEDSMRELEDLSSPVNAFVRDSCVVEPGMRVAVDDLYAAWEQWCERDGRDRSTTKQRFGRDLAAAVPSVACRRSSDNARFYDGITLKQ